MLEFFKTNYFLIFYGVTLVVSIIRYPKYYDSELKYFPILIAYTLLCELLGVLIRDFESFQIYYGSEYSDLNSLIYNIFDFIFYLYFFYVFWQRITKSKSKKLIQYGAVLFVIASVINPFFQDLRIFPQSYAVAVGSIFLVICIFLFYPELKQGNEKIAIHRNLLFWISLGLLAFYPFYPLLISNWAWDSIAYQKYNIREIHLGLIAIMYGCFLVGFIRMRRMLPTQHDE